MLICHPDGSSISGVYRLINWRFYYKPLWHISAILVLCVGLIRIKVSRKYHTSKIIKVSFASKIDQVTRA